MIKKTFHDNIDWQARENRLFNKEFLAGEYNILQMVEVEITNVPLRGFAALLPKTISKIGKKGMKALRDSGKAHCFTTEEGKKYGSEGGKKSAIVRKKSK